MRQIGVFINVSLDGYFSGPNGEIDWFKEIEKDKKWKKHADEQSQAGGTLLMGRTTYELMKSFWPTDEGRRSDPQMAKVMNERPKIVVSRTLPPEPNGPVWKNVTVIRELDPERIRQEANSPITILGSGSIIQQLTSQKVIDQFELVVVPVVLGEGKPLFKDVKRTGMELVSANSYDNGLVSLRYKPA